MAVPRENRQVVGTYLLPEEETTRIKTLCFRLRQVRYTWYARWKYLGDHIELLMASPDKPSPLFNKETDWHAYVLDSNYMT